MDEKSAAETGRITVSADTEAEIEADHVELFVTIRGSSLFTGRAALTKARELAQLVADLQAAGVAEAEIKLQGVRAEVTTGVLGRSSSALYSLKIRCSRLESLADVLGAITSQKNTTLNQMLWGYSEYESLRLERLEECVRRARHRAERIAAGLGVRLIGVARCTEGGSDPEGGVFAQPMQRFGVEHARTRALDARVEDLGMDVSHSKRITLSITVEYYVSGFNEAA